jgi:mono/diheme cytochrome c family protein
VRFLRQLRSVLWSFFGVRRRADSARDLEGARPATLILAGAIVATAFVLGIAGIVRLVTGPREAVPVAPAETTRSSDSTAGSARTAAAAPVPDTLEERVRACAACHGSTTQSAGNAFSPRIAGKPAAYLYNQLESFRDGRRTYAPMVHLVRFLSDEYLREMAAYFAALELPYAPPEPATLSPAQVARVRELVTRGDPALDVPACTTCHGVALLGREPAIPGLLGLPRDYLAFQFGAWRNGELRSLPPDCMGEIARRMRPDDVPALAAWLAAQPVPGGAKPEAATGERLPMACGGVEAAQRNRATTATAPLTPEQARGRDLVTAGDCIACHTAPGGEPFAGGRAIATPFGTIYSTNLTPDAATGLGTWTPEAFRRALHEGRSNDGRALYPAFPYPNFTLVSDGDSDAMFAYLRMLPPVARPATPHALRFPYSTQAALVIWRTLYFRAGDFVPDPGQSDEWNRGAYLVRGLGHCGACHATRNLLGAVGGDLDLGGGLIPMQNWYAPPLVAPHGRGAANWDAEDLRAFLASGISRRGTAMGPMGEVVWRSTQHLPDEDLRAIATYLRSYATTPAPRAAGRAADADVLARGQRVYVDRCADCHGDDGAGRGSAYPPLAGNASVTGDVAANAIKAVLFGGYAPSTREHPRPFGMPPFFHELRSDDVAAVLTYVRKAWGHDADPVSAADVERYRDAR